MNTRRTAVVLVGMILAGWSSTALAAYCGLTSALCGSHGCVQKCCPECQWKCQKVVKKCPYTVWEPITEKVTKTVYDCVWENRTVTKVHRVCEIQCRDESFTYSRPIYESRTKEVPYTVTWPVYETRTREVPYVIHVPSYETRKRSIPYTTYRTVYDTYQRTLRYCVPRSVSYPQCITVCCGHWETRVEECPGPKICRYVQTPGCWVETPCQKGSCQKGSEQKGCCSQKGNCVYQPGKCQIVQEQCPPIRCCRCVWVPRYEQRTVMCCKTVYDWQSQTVPYTVCRAIPQTHTCVQEYTICRLNAVRQSRLVEYQVTRTMSEQRMRTVSYNVTTAVQEIGTRRVPVATHRDIPTTCCVCEPRQVPREVCCTVTRCVPKTCYREVDVYIYTPVPTCCPKCPCQKGPSCQKSCEASALDAEAALAEIEATERNEAAAEEVLETTVLPVSLKTELPEVNEAEAAAASRHFATGLEAYRDGKFAAASESFSAATSAAPSAAKYAYFHALALYSAGNKTEAETQLAIAVELDAAAPVSNWGRAMERVQGAARLWVEAARP